MVVFTWSILTLSSIMKPKLYIRMSRLYCHSSVSLLCSRSHTALLLSVWVASSLHLFLFFLKRDQHKHCDIGHVYAHNINNILWRYSLSTRMVWMLVQSLCAFWEPAHILTGLRFKSYVLLQCWWISCGRPYHSNFVVLCRFHVFGTGTSLFWSKCMKWF